MAQNVKCVTLLLGARADPNQTTTSKLTPLMLAAQLGALEVVQQLLDAGARVDFSCQPGSDTTLHRAPKGKNATVLKLLLDCPEARKILNWRDAHGSSVTWLALTKGDPDMFALSGRKSLLARFIEITLTGIERLTMFVNFGLYSLILGLPIALVLDVGLLILSGREDRVLNLSLPDSWSKPGGTVAWICWVLLVWIVPTRHLPPTVWALLMFLITIRGLFLQRLKQADQAESFRWSIDTVFYSRLLVIYGKVLLVARWLVWFGVKRVGPFLACTAITGGLLRYHMESIIEV